VTQPMKRLQFGKTGPTVSVLGLGCWTARNSPDPIPNLCVDGSAQTYYAELLVNDIDRLAREVKDMKALPATKRRIGFIIDED
jgi:hypothetical protein